MLYYTINNTTLIFQIEKCQDVTLGYSTEKQCDKWPKTVCELNKVTRKRYTPETKCEKSRREVIKDFIQALFYLINYSIVSNKSA